MKGATWIVLGSLVILAVAGVWALQAAGVDLTQFGPEHLRLFFLSFGLWAPLIYLVIYSQPVIPLPCSVMTLTAGLAFGPLWGTTTALVGSTVRACTTFGMARWLGRDLVAKYFKRPMAGWDRVSKNHGFTTVVLIRLIPNFPFDIQNYGLGLSRVRFWPYILGTIVGLVPGSFAYVYLGDSLTDRRQLWKVIVALLILVGLSVFQRAIKARAPNPR